MPGAPLFHLKLRPESIAVTLVRHLHVCYPQQRDFLDAGAAGVEPQPHPAAPVDFNSASRTQQASATVGAGPPQHVLGAAWFCVVDASVPDAFRVAVWA